MSNDELQKLALQVMTGGKLVVDEAKYKRRKR